MSESIARGAASRPVYNAFDDDADDPPVKALTRDEAQALRERYPQLSPWRVIVMQTILGGVAAVLAWLWAGSMDWVGSALYGAATAVLPGALMARGMTRKSLVVSPGASAFGVMTWTLVKWGASITMLVAAPRLVQPLSWPVLLATLVVCMQVYWFALLWRGR
jgi:ATP synthase protein I